jgi:hypothetical protein
MNNRNFGVLLIPLLAALAVVLPLTSGTNPPAATRTSVGEQTKVQASQKQEESTPLRGAKKLLGNFLGKDAVEPKELANYELSFLIATVPDPIDSSLGYMFDRNAAAIQRAAEAAGYLLDRFDLPWADKEDQEKRRDIDVADHMLDRLRKPAADKKDEEKLKGRRHQREAATILFRGYDNNKDPKLLLLFLVGETPTGGIHKTALKSAMEQVAAICGWGRKPHCDEFRMNAPTFSGSSDSLIEAFQRWRERKDLSSGPHRFQLISGSATAISSEKKTYLKKLGASYLATVIEDEYSLKMFLNYLRSTAGASCREIAILTESGTGYGRQETLCPDKKEPMLTLTYPFHVSQLRSTAEKTRPAGKESATAPPSLRPQNLRLSLEEGNEPKDLVPPFSSFDTFSVELVLSNILSTISRERIRYLGIFSTDIRDQIFLARKIREVAPNVVLFTFSAELIYLHTDVNLDFQGMLVVSTYPLFNRNQLWTYPFKGVESRLQFASDTAQGVYNATLLLLHTPDKMVEYGRPFDCGRDPKAPRTPPVWLTAVGHSDLWPIKLLDQIDPEKCPDNAQQASSSPGLRDHTQQLGLIETRPGLYPKSLVPVLLSLILVCALPYVGMLLEFCPYLPLKGKVRGLKQRTNWRMMKLLGDAIFFKYRQLRLLYLMAFSLALLTATFIIVRVLLRILVCRLSPRSCDFEIVLKPDATLDVNKPLSVLILILILGLPTIFVALQYIKPFIFSGRSLKDRVEDIFSLLSVVFPPLLVFVLAAWYGREISSLATSAQLFVYFRMLNLESGLSPLLPLLFVGGGGLLWLLCCLRRMHFLEELHHLNPQFGQGSLGDVAILETRLKKLLGCSLFALPWSPLVLVFVGIPCFLLFIGIGGDRWFSLGLPSVGGLIRAGEEKYFYWFFGWAFIFVYLAFALTFLRFLILWRETRKLLHRLSCHPILPAYRSLPKKFLQTPRINLSSISQTAPALEFSVEQAGQLTSLANHLFSFASTVGTLSYRVASHLKDLNRLARQAERRRTWAFVAEARGKWRKGIIFRNSSERALSKMSLLVAQALEPQWGSTAIALSKDEKSWLVMAEHFLAGRVVVFLRHIFFHLGNLVYFVTVGLLLMLLAVNSYPFQPREPILWFNWAVILTSVVLTTIVFVQINRDKIVSLLTGTTPGQINWNQEFVVRVILYGLVPILALLGAQFPEGLRNIVSWLSISQGTH